MPTQEAIEQIHFTSLQRLVPNEPEMVLKMLKQEHWVSTDCEALIRQMVFGVDGRSEQIAIASLRALDFFESAPYADVLQVAKKKFGLTRCSKEDACDLRLQLRQRKGESLFVTIAPAFPELSSRLFNLKADRHDGTSRICLIDPNKQYLRPDDLLVFRSL